MFEIVTLPNGLRIVMEKIPFVRSITFGIWVKNGSRNEDINTNGISHFIEHMFFKGTSNRTAKDIADEIDAVGGQINAYTSKEYTCYYTRTLDTHFDVALDVLSDMFFRSNFNEEDIEKERNVILEEINMYEDTPEELVHDLLQSSIWPDNPLSYPILGTSESISTFRNATFKNYYHKNYHPKNTVIAIAGNFKTDEIVKKVESYFGRFHRDNDYHETKYHTEYKPCIATKEKDIEQVHLSFGFPSIPIGSDFSYTLSILNTVFGGGMSSRLFQTVREQYGLAYSIYSYNSSFVETGLFSIYAGLNPSQTENVIQLIISEIQRLSSEKITEDQLMKTKEQIKSNYLLSLESSSTRMNSLGKSELMLNKILTPDEIIAKIDYVTLDKIDELISKIFDLDKISLSAVGNIKGFNFQEMIHNAR